MATTPGNMENLENVEFDNLGKKNSKNIKVENFEQNLEFCSKIIEKPEFLLIRIFNNFDIKNKYIYNF